MGVATASAPSILTYIDLTRRKHSKSMFEFEKGAKPSVRVLRKPLIHRTGPVQEADSAAQRLRGCRVAHGGRAAAAVGRIT